jgi:hypothetical protein
MLNKRQRFRWWLREARLPRERRIMARAERWSEMAKHPDQRKQDVADHGVVDGEAHHSRGADFHRN